MTSKFDFPVIRCSTRVGADLALRFVELSKELLKCCLAMGDEVESGEDAGLEAYG